MKTLIPSLRSLIPMSLVAALATSGCSNLSPDEKAAIAAGVFGTAAGVALGCAGVKPEITIPVVLGAAALAGGATYIYAKNQATLAQRRLAESRAKAYYAGLSAKKKAKVGTHLAVKTSNTPANQGQAVMLYNIQTGDVGNSVYDVKAPPATGQQTKIESTPAIYIGSGE